MSLIVMRAITLIVSLLFSAAATAASFNCDKARAPIEKLICSDPGLSKLDEELNAVYQQTLTQSAQKALITHWQRAWLKSYNVTTCEDATCLKAAFSSRINLLKSVSPGDAISTRWNGRYVQDTDTILLIALTGDRVYVSGFATWYGPNAKMGQVNTGEMEGIGNLRSAKAFFDLDGCTAEMALKGNGLVVEKESGCGGLNVSFVGEYRRK